MEGSSPPTLSAPKRSLRAPVRGIVPVTSLCFSAASRQFSQPVKAKLSESESACYVELVNLTQVVGKDDVSSDEIWVFSPFARILGKVALKEVSTASWKRS